MNNILELAREDLAVYVELLKELDQEQVIPLEQAERLFDKVKAYPFYKLYKVLIKEEVVGTFTLILCDNFGHGGLKFAVLENVVVHPDFHRQGLGKKMIEEALRIAANNGCYKLMLSSNEKRLDAHAFYDSLGFQRHGISYKTELIT